jgi:clan AA aspartic protease (TIGR02281 family)
MQKEDGVYTIPCMVNGLKLRFIFDTGASNVCISLTEATFMLKNGYLESNDILGNGKSQVADGSLVENKHIILRHIEIGEMNLDNVDAIVMNNMKAPLLLGQSAIQKLGAVQMQGDELILLNGNATIPSLKKRSGAYWYDACHDKEQMTEIDLNSIERKDDYIICYEKTTYYEENKRKEELNSYSDIQCYGVSNEECIKIKQKWKFFSYTISKYIYDYKKNMYAWYYQIYYDKNGSEIYRDEHEIKWTYIIPESIGSFKLETLQWQYQIFYKGQTYNVYLEDAYPFLIENPDAKIIK